LPNLQVGTFVLNLELLAYFAAGALGALAVRYRLRGSPERERRTNEAWNAVFLWLAVWKGSLLLFDPQSVFRHPLSLMFFSGGTKGLWLAFIASSAYLIWRSYRRDGRREAVRSAATWTASVAAAVLLGIILLTDGADWLHYAGFLASAVAAAFLLSPTPKAAARRLGAGLIAAMVVYAVLDPGDVRQARVAEAAPDFELTSLEGEPVRLSDYRGKTVVMNFWATWCRVCQAEMPHVEKFYRDHLDEDVVVLSVNATSQERNSEKVFGYADKEGLSFPIVLDEKGDVLDLYGVTAYPTTYIVDPEGNVRERYLGAISYESMKKAVKLANEAP